jgi:hypothetical protein
MFRNVELHWQTRGWHVGKDLYWGTFVEMEGVDPASAYIVKGKLRHFSSLRTIVEPRFERVPSQCEVLLFCIQLLATNKCVLVSDWSLGKIKKKKKIELEVNRNWSHASSCRTVPPYHPTPSPSTSTFYCFV